MSRGRRFALGQPPRRDEFGHSLPSDHSMRFVAVDLLCPRHPDRGVPLRLARFAIHTDHDEFRSEEVHERGENRAVERQVIKDPDGTTRVRYKMRCPVCGHAPVWRAERIDQVLRHLYERGVYERIVRLPA